MIQSEAVDISIIVPCYNVETFLECAILSVIKQPHHNIELLLINDGSKDGTETICQKYQYIDSRVKYYKTENKGAGHARNFGINRSKGKWIMFLDADDLYLPNSISDELIKKLANYFLEDIQIVYTSNIYCDMGLMESPKICDMPQTFHHIPPQAFWNAIYARDLLVGKGVKFFEFKEQDIETAFRIRAYLNAKKTIVDRTTFFYLQRMNMQSNTHTWKTNTLHYVRCLVYDALQKEDYPLVEKKWLHDEMMVEVYCFFRDYTHNLTSNSQKRKVLSILLRTNKFANLNHREWGGLYLNTLKIDIKNLFAAQKGSEKNKAQNTLTEVSWPVADIFDRLDRLAENLISELNGMKSTFNSD